MNKVPDVLQADFYYILLKWEGKQKIDFDGKEKTEKA